MLKLLSSLLLSVLISPDNSTDSVEYIDLNYFGHAEKIENLQKCYIYRDANKRIIDWRWLSNAGETVKVAPGKYMQVFYDTQDGNKKLRIIYSSQYREYYTPHDQEVKERERLPHERRRLLSK